VARGKILQNFSRDGIGFNTSIELDVYNFAFNLKVSTPFTCVYKINGGDASKTTVIYSFHSYLVFSTGKLWQNGSTFDIWSTSLVELGICLCHFDGHICHNLFQTPF